MRGRRFSGVYVIHNTANDIHYIGVSGRVNTRLHEHRYRLERGQHHNPGLQADWNLYGESVFVFEVLEELDPSNPDWNQEIEWMNKYAAEGKRLYTTRLPPLPPLVSFRLSDDMIAAVAWLQEARAICVDEQAQRGLDQLIAALWTAQAQRAAIAERRLAETAPPDA